MTKKICKKCNLEKLISEFEFRKDSNSYRHTCIDCKNKQNKINYYKQITSQSFRNKRNIYKIEYQKLNKEKIQIYNKNYRKKNKKYFSEYNRNRRKIDIHFKLRQNLAIRINRAMKLNLKGQGTIDLLGCSIKYLKQHLESQFQPDMTWNNYGDWHIDHRKSCASFDLSKKLEQLACFNYLNLQPLWADQNFSKGAKICQI